MRHLVVIMSCVVCAVVGARALPAQWRVQVSRDQMTDETTALFTLTSSSTERDGIGSRARSELVLRCRGRAIEDLFIATPRFLANNTEIDLRFDQQPLVTEDWSPSKDQTALFAPDPPSLVSAMLRSRDVRVAYAPYQERARVARFAVNGMSTVLPALNRHCGSGRQWSTTSEHPARIEWRSASGFRGDTVLVLGQDRLMDITAQVLRRDGTPLPYAPPLMLRMVSAFGKSVPVDEDLELRPGRYRMAAFLGTTRLAPEYPLVVVEPTSPAVIERGDRQMIAARKATALAGTAGSDGATFEQLDMIGDAMCGVMQLNGHVGDRFRIIVSQLSVLRERDTAPDVFAREWSARCKGARAKGQGSTD